MIIIDENKLTYGCLAMIAECYGMYEECVGLHLNKQVYEECIDGTIKWLKYEGDEEEYLRRDERVEEEWKERRQMIEKMDKEYRAKLDKEYEELIRYVY